MDTLYFCRVNSPVGPLLLASSEAGLAILAFDRGVFPPRSTRFSKSRWQLSDRQLRHHVRELQQYFAGERRRFTFPLDLRGTDFQMRCWRALLDIPYGEVRSYADMARAVGQPRAFRAVGMANHDNPIAIVVPCHRVVASDGTLGGYGGGLPAKQTLLELEGVSFQKAYPLALHARGGDPQAIVSSRQ